MLAVHNSTDISFLKKLPFERSGRAVQDVVLGPLNTEIVVSNPARGMDICPRIFALQALRRPESRGKTPETSCLSSSNTPQKMTNVQLLSYNDKPMYTYVPHTCAKNNYFLYVMSRKELPHCHAMWVIWPWFALRGRMVQK